MNADLIRELELLGRVAEKAAELAADHGHKSTSHFLAGIAHIVQRITDEIR